MRTLVCLAALVVLATGFVLQPQQDNAISCTLCKIGVNVADPPVDKEVHNVEDEFDAECKKALGSIPFAAQECEKYANSKLDPIIKELEGGTAPDDVCNKLQECP